MKKLLVLLVSIFTLISANNLIAQNNIDISKYNCFTAPVKFFADGAQTSGLLVFLNYSDKEMPALHYSNVYILNKKGQNYQLVGDSSAFTGVEEIRVSPESRYLALLMVGEGHPWIEIYDLQKLIQERKQVLITTINPYPGNVNLIAWQGTKLIVESDINLLLKNEGKDLSDKDVFDKFRKFIFDMDTKMFKEVK